MVDVAKYAWLSFFSFLFLGYWTFVLVAVEIIVCLLYSWLRRVKLRNV